MEKEQPTINLETRKYRLTGITPLLGSQPANPDVRTAYIESKAPDPAAATAEETQLLIRENLDDKTLTVFLRDPAQRDALMILDYVILGYLKSAIDILKAQNHVKAAAGKVDKYLFAAPRKLYITKGGRREDSLLERPLRAKTMQGDRVALTASELIEDPWEIEVKLTLLPNEGAKTETGSKPITFDVVEQALALGCMKGLGQWRNGGYGRFTYERVF